MLLFIDGFDHYGTVTARLLDGVYAETAGVTLSAVNPRTGARAARIAAGTNNAGLRRVLPGDRDIVGVAYAFTISELPTNNTSFGLIQFRDNGNVPLATLTVTSTGQLQWRDGPRTGPIRATSGPVILAGSYQHFQVQADFDSDSVEVRINGVTVLNAAGVVITEPGVPAQIKIGVNGFPLTGAAGIIWDVDDLAAWDAEGASNNDFIGDKKVYTRLPTSDGPEQDWTPSIGVDGFPMIDNVPPLDATEYLTAADGDASLRSSFGLDDFPAEIVSVAGVYLATRLWKTDAGDAKVRVGIESGGTEAQGDEHALSMAPIWYGDVFEVNPSTAGPWSVSALNGAMSTIERTE